MGFTKYRSEAAAARAKARLERAVPSCRVEITEDLRLLVWAYEALLSPTEREALTGHQIKQPAPPTPGRPLLDPIPPREIKDPSTVDRPVAVCRRVFEEFWREGRIDDRTAAIEACVALGVTFNTAKTIYPQFRTEKGIPSSIRLARARARSRKIDLKAYKRPEAVRVCNGVAEPAPGTMSREVWDMADVLLRKLRRTPRRGEVAKRLPEMGFDTIKRSYPLWRKFNALPFAGQYHERG